MNENNGKDTKDRILEAAEERFAEDGFAGTSLRSITAHAGVNLAAIHYHYGSKAALIEAVFERRIQPINRERIALLDAIESSPGRPASVEQILEAFLGPPLRLYGCECKDGRAGLMRVYGRVLSEPDDELQKLFLHQFKEVASRFSVALERALPELSAEDLFWRMHFVIGAMAHALADTHGLHFLSKGLCKTDDVESTIRRLVEFLSAGMKAQVTATTTGGRG